MLIQVLGKTYKQKEVLVKEIKEIPVIPLDKLDLMIKGLNDISKTLKEMKELFSEINNENQRVKERTKRNEY